MLSFLIYITVTSITPGPSNLFIMLSSKTFGIKGASRFIAGILAGFLFLACLSLVLLYTLNDLLPEIQSVLKYLGFVYLLYLAYKTFKMSVDEDESKAYQSFKSGFLIQIFNMKSLLIFITLLGAFIMQIADDLVTTIIYMAITVIVGWLYLLIWGFAGSFLKDLLNKYDLPFRIVMSLLLVYSAISIFL